MIGIIEYLIVGYAMIYTLKTLGLKYYDKNLMIALIWWPVIVAISFADYLKKYEKNDKE